jgi:fused signal recognition particle receptor
MTDTQRRVNDKKGFLTRLRERISRFRGSFVKQMDQLLSGKKTIDRELLEELEEIMVMADMGVGTVEDIFDRLSSEVDGKELMEPSSLRERLKEILLEMLTVNGREAGDGQVCGGVETAPCVILVVGVNGVGKTTTIAKLAHHFRQSGKKPLLVAADTFRAAAVEQLGLWGERLSVPVVSKDGGADPSAVVFDGLDVALKRGVDVVLVDTAGRLHTAVNLMEELKKLKKVINRKIQGAPHEIMLVLDATTGQNAINQARLFMEATDITGVILTKLDGTARGGVVISIAGEMDIPVRYIGVGEGMEDLLPFVPSDFVEALFEG